VRMGLDAMVSVHAILSMHAAAVLDPKGPQWTKVDKVSCANLALRFRHYYPQGVMVVDGKRAGGKSAAQQRIKQRAENEAKLAASSAIVDDLKQAVRQQDAARNPGASVIMSATTARLALEAVRGSPRTHSRTLGDNGAEAGPAENNAGAGGSDSMADNVGAAEVSDLRAAEKRQSTMQKTVVGKFGPEAACRLRDICHQLDIRFEVALGEAEHHLRQLAVDDHIDAVWTVDTDTVIVGFNDITFSNSVCNLSMQNYVQVLNMAHMQSLLNAGTNPGGKYGAKLGSTMRTFGVMPTLRILGYALPNDYEHTNGMGLFRITKVLAALEDRKVETLTVETFAEQAEISIELNVSSSMQRSMALCAPTGTKSRWRKMNGPKYAVAKRHTEKQLKNSERFWGPRQGKCICSDMRCKKRMTTANSRQRSGYHPRPVSGQ